MAKRRGSSGDAIARLGEYFIRAKIMHELMELMLDEFVGDIHLVEKQGHWIEFETYMCFWLAGLFVVVEGFNKLKLKDKRVQKLFVTHLQELKALRHEIYHFTLKRDAGSVIAQIGWAKDLHHALGDYIHQNLQRKLKAERQARREARLQKKKKTES